MSDAFLSGVTFKRGNADGPPETFTSIGEPYNISGVGKTNSLVDVTNFESGGVMEYISGFADGAEITVECNFLPANTSQQGMIADVDNKAQRNIEMEIDDGTTNVKYEFAVTPLNWTVSPAFTDRNTISFTLKITGDITITTT